MPSARAPRRKLSDYCGIFAEKTNKIGKNVESFMQSRGLLPIRRSVDETPPLQPRDDAFRGNSDAVGNDSPRNDRGSTGNEDRNRCEIQSYEWPQSGGRKTRPAFSNGTYPRDSRANARYVHRSNETEPRRSRRREYAANYTDDGDFAWRDATRGPTASRPILRNGIDHGGDESRRYSTLPRRSRTINFEDEQHARGNYSAGEGRSYPKSLQNLTDLEPDDVTYLCPSTAGTGGGDYREGRLDDYRQRRNRREDESSLDDDYLRFCRNLSRLDKYPRGGGRYEPGEVHYERECRTFGKDTVAFIYYKTCYL